MEGHANPLEVGRVAQWDGPIDNCTHQNHLIRARLDQTRCLPVYACHLLNSARGAAHFRRSGKTTSGPQHHQHIDRTLGALLLPPIDLQRAFRTQFDQIAVQRATEIRSRESLDALAASLALTPIRQLNQALIGLVRLTLRTRPRPALGFRQTQPPAGHVQEIGGEPWPKRGY